ncbi:hypothetical protein LCGC14_1116840 [marine sediment metagenome]|uniref:Uncharacterized protein n=1 Tax=marine sediment metagenome TaxID=412755 RepID=A0A0F9MSZ7_9ZZZZ
MTREFESLPTLDKVDLERLEKKYFSPPHFLILQTDDSAPIHIVKGGAEDARRLSRMYGDMQILLKELRRLLELVG